MLQTSNEVLFIKNKVLSDQMGYLYIEIVTISTLLIKK